MTRNPRRHLNSSRLLSPRLLSPRLLSLRLLSPRLLSLRLLSPRLLSLRLLSPLTTIYGLALLTGCRSYAPPTPLSQLTPQQSRGHAVFLTRCALCHNDRTDDPLHGPSLLAIFKKPYLHSGAPANDDRVTYTVLHGHNLMPAQPALDPAVNPGDLDDLLTYLHTL